MPETSDMDYNLNSYEYELPAGLIAQEPLKKRDNSKLLHLNKETGVTGHYIFSQLPGLLTPEHFLIFNNTRVFPARLEAERLPGKGKIELLLLNNREGNRWEALVKPGRKVMPGIRFICGDILEGTVEEYIGPGRRIVSLSPCGGGDNHHHHNECSPGAKKAAPSMNELIRLAGSLPLPPYIKQKPADPEQYQTVHGHIEGSVAAPTAGLHFSREIFAGLQKAGIGYSFLTLHVGPGTFLPVKDRDIREHDMHTEYYHLNAEAAEQINAARQQGKIMVAVGTTACRVLETISDHRGQVREQEGETGIFIYPGYRFKITGGLLTNFHLPASTLLMLVSALAGRENIMKAYQEAISREYRFYSFGDAMLIL